MKIFLLGDYTIPGGPSQVNRQLLKYMPKDTMVLKSNGKLAQLIEVINKTILADIIIYSNPMRVGIPSLIITKLLRKKSIYLMHGCIRYESQENKQPNPVGQMIEEMSLKYSKLILCVSGPFLKWSKEQYPEYANKMNVLTNGIEWEEIIQKNRDCVRDDNLIIAMGAGRRTKRNLQIAKAVSEINDENGLSLRFEVYGNKNKYDDTKLLEEERFCTMKGRVSRKEMLSKLRTAGLYIQNSVFEPFGLAVIEALMCGCNILISQNVGARDILSTEARDVICEPDNLEEIKNKILYVLMNPNNTRLVNQMNHETTSASYAAKKLLDYCELIYKEENGIC